MRKAYLGGWLAQREAGRFPSMDFNQDWWRRYERRHAKAPKPRLPFPEWTGEDLTGKRLVVWPEQGLGDKIMFARWLPALAEHDVTILCEPALVRLFHANFAGRVIEANGRTDFPDPDFWALYGSLPLLTGAPIGPGPYISSPASTASDARIGVCARGSPQHPNDARRSLSADAAQVLLELPGAMSLHVDDTGAQDFLETAAIISGLELVVTVDTAIAHLAGAMGKPVWILLPSQGVDWRWGSVGSVTAWYPSAKLIRQRQGETWSAVVRRIQKLIP